MKMDFEQACAHVQAGLFDATDSEKLRLYALYKVATSSTPAGGASLVDAAKHDAYEKARPLTPTEAAREYSDTVCRLVLKG